MRMEKIMLAVVIILKEHEDGMTHFRLNKAIRDKYGYDEKSVDEAIGRLIKEGLVVDSLQHYLEIGGTYRVTATSEDKLYLTVKFNYGKILDRLSGE